MHIRHIRLSSRFLKRWEDVSEEVRVRAHKATDLFRENPFHPSLRLHRLKGKMRLYWSISVDLKHRIICRLDGDTAYFTSIGTHAIYEKP